MLRFLLLLLLLLLLPNLFIWWNYTRLQAGFIRTFLLLLPTAITILTIFVMLTQARSPWLMQMLFIMVICIAVPKLAFTLVAGCGKLFSIHSPGIPLLATRIGIGFAIVTAGFQVFGSGWGWRHLKVDRHEMVLPSLPKAFEGYRLVQITDLHVGTYAGDVGFINTLVDSINSLKPDMIVFTGDLVNTSAGELSPFVRPLSRLQANDGVFSILGNHDYCTYHPGITTQERQREVQQIIRAQELMGWNVLLDENEAIKRNADSIFVAGVENIGKPPFPSHGNLDTALRGIPQGATTILLSHDPWHWRHGILHKTDVALTLSGHTHALQMQVGRFSPAAWFMPEWGGLYTEGQQQLYVSTGIGGSVPYRLGAWPKIELFTLTAKQSPLR